MKDETKMSIVKILLAIILATATAMIFFYIVIILIIFVNYFWLDFDPVLLLFIFLYWSLLIHYHRYINQLDEKRRLEDIKALDIYNDWKGLLDHELD
jgi:fatty acid desaturase